MTVRNVAGPKVLLVAIALAALVPEHLVCIVPMNQVFCDCLVS